MWSFKAWWFTSSSSLQIAVVVRRSTRSCTPRCSDPTPTPPPSKLTKPVWLLILGGGVLLTLVLGITGAAIAAVAAGVYLVDVRPKILEIQGKSR